MQRRADFTRTRGVEQRPHMRIGARPRRGEQRHLMTAVNQGSAQQVNNRLDPPVARHRHRDPRRRQHGNPPLVTADSPAATLTTPVRGRHHRDRIDDGLRAYRALAWIVGVRPCMLGIRHLTLRYSSAAGSAEENNFTGIRARAMHRGQYSTANQPAFGRMLSPHRGQFRNGKPRSFIRHPGQLERGASATLLTPSAGSSCPPSVQPLARGRSCRWSS